MKHCSSDSWNTKYQWKPTLVAPNVPCLMIVIPLCSLLPQRIRAYLCDLSGMTEVMTCDFQGLILKRICLPSCFLELLALRQASRHVEDTEVALWRGPYGEGLRHPFSTNLSALWMSNLGSGSPSLIQPSDHCSPSWHLTATSYERLWAKSLSNSFPTKLWQIINVSCCFKHKVLG